MEHGELIEQVLATWRRHNEILLFLLDQIPDPGLSAVPAQSRGRDVARQFEHLDRVRRGWLHFHATGERRKLPRDKDVRPKKVQLTRDLKASGAEVEKFMRSALVGDVRPRMFGRK